jgi:hypothetical protein
MVANSPFATIKPATSSAQRAKVMPDTSRVKHIICLASQDLLFFFKQRAIEIAGFLLLFMSRLAGMSSAG